MQSLIGIACCQCCIHGTGQCAYACLEQSLEPCTNYVECEEEHDAHYRDESRDSGVLAGQEAVYLLTSDPLFAFMRLAYSLGCDLLDEGKTHVCYCSASVKSALFFHLEHDVFNGLFLVLIEPQAADDYRVTFDDFGRGKSQRDTCAQCMVFDEV